MMEKKFQVFISSTYTDLVEARTKVRDAILSMQHFPVGMEVFGAANEEQWQIISETIDSSDYYVLIIAQRYGSVIKEGSDAGLSYTEKEFRYAIEKKIPVLAFILDDNASVKPQNIEDKYPDKLKAFKIQVKEGRLVEWWKTPDELAQKVTAALYKQITRTKRPGWIRGDKVDVERSLNTITELTERNQKIVDENKQLKEKVKRLEFSERLVCNGKKYLDSKATVSFDIGFKKYILSFEKRYIIISETIKWYEGQLYCDRFLDSLEKSKEYYKTHRLDWAALNFQAKLKYKNTEDTHFSREIQVIVLCIAEDNNYKKYKIQYMTKDGDKLNIKQGTEIILNYSYEVPVSLWGSYLNRYISYWDETACVKFTCTDYLQISKEYFKVYQTGKNGEKYLCEDAVVSEDNLENRNEIIFSLPQKAASQFSIWWDADRIFGVEGLNTIMVADKSQLSRY